MLPNKRLGIKDFGVLIGFLHGLFIELIWALRADAIQRPSTPQSSRRHHFPDRQNAHHYDQTRILPAA
jgi:hypothetical protein